MVEDDPLERFISDLINQFYAEGRRDLFYESNREEGQDHSAYYRRLLLKVLDFGYCQQTRNSRKFARLLERDDVFRFLDANHQPDFRTNSDFRKSEKLTS